MQRPRERDEGRIQQGAQFATQFTRFTSTNVQILTPEELLFLQADVIQEALEPRTHPNPKIATDLALHATQESWSKMAFGQCPDHLIQKTCEIGDVQVIRSLSPIH